MGEKSVERSSGTELLLVVGMAVGVELVRGTKPRSKLDNEAPDPVSELEITIG